MIKRNKSLRDYNSSDFVKYFVKKYNENYEMQFQIVFARDCSIMLKVMRKFFEAKIDFKEIFTFMDKMFLEYPKRRRIKSIDINWLYGVVDLYLKKPGDFGKDSGNKIKTPEIILDDDMKKWLEAEKKKWLK